MKSSIYRADTIMKENYVKAILEHCNAIWVVGSRREGIFFVDYLKRNGIEVKGIFDIEREQIGKVVQGKKVMPLTTVSIGKYDAVFIASLEPEVNRMVIGELCGKQIRPEQVIPAGAFLTDLLARENCFINEIDHSTIALPYLANFDIVDACNIQCNTCMRKDIKGTNHKMDIETFKLCLDKLKKLGISYIEMHNKTEPFLHPDILEFIKEVKKRNFQCTLSSNLSLPVIPDLKKVVDCMEVGRDTLVISISGVKQEIYEINHNGGKISNVIKNLEQISASDNRKVAVLRLLLFDYNYSEILPTIQLAEKYGINYQIMEASGDPIKQKVLVDNTYAEKINLGSYNKNFDNLDLCHMLFEYSFTINSHANVLLCCNSALTPPYDLGSFLDQDISVIQIKRMLHPACANCTTFRDNKNFNEANRPKINYLIQRGFESLMKINNLKPGVYYEHINEQAYLSAALKYFLSHYNF